MKNVSAFILAGLGVALGIWAWLTGSDETGPEAIGPGIEPEDQLPAEPETGTSTPTFKPKTATFKPNTGVGGSSGGGENPTTVPNQSGDAAGYNTELFNNSQSVRYVMNALGYSMPVINAQPPQAAVVAFIEDYNAASDLGILDATGYLLMDAGIAGKNVLNALERVAYGAPNQQFTDPERFNTWKDEFGLWGA